VILVTVGMNPFGFDRLARVADELAELVDEPVVIQAGASSYIPRFAQYFDFASPENMEQWIRDARVVVTHCAAGSILSVLAVGRPIVAVPRLKRFGEAMDDHQQELGESLASTGSIFYLTEVTPRGLGQAIDEADQMRGTSASEGAPVVEALAEYLASL
jgi:beta-1,4-N-acetylglucosaminyltransferase